MPRKQRETIRAVVNTATKVKDATAQLEGFLSRVFGTAPKDAAGFLGGDWLREVRIRNLDSLAQQPEEVIRERRIENGTEPVSPSVAIRLLRAAQNESCDELRELWARLLANGMDASRSKSVRASVVKTVEQFDPLDGVLLQYLHSLFPLVEREQ